MEHYIQTHEKAKKLIEKSAASLSCDEGVPHRRAAAPTTLAARHPSPSFGEEELSQDVRPMVVRRPCKAPILTISTSKGELDSDGETTELT